MSEAELSDQPVLEEGFKHYEQFIDHSSKHAVLADYIDDRLKTFCQERASLRMLDIGTGNGRLLAAVIGAFERAGIDYHIDALEPSAQARARFRRKIGDNPRVRLIDQHFPAGDTIRPGDFDLVLASHVSYYFQDKTRFVEQVMNLLRPGGQAIFVTTSIDMLQNELYQGIFPLLRANPSLPRLAEAIGYMGFAEELEHELFVANIPYERQRLPSKITFDNAQIEQELALLESGSEAGGAILHTLSFLWQYSIASLLTEKPLWVAYLHHRLAEGKGITIDYADLALMTRPLGKFDINHFLRKKP